MKILIASLVIVLLIAIALLHVYWVFGGTWGIEAAIPEKFKDVYFNERNAWKNQIATSIVAMGLMIFATIIVANIFNLSFLKNEDFVTICTRIIAAIFLVRAIGDFTNFGLFKRTSEDKFAYYDTRIFIPLCLFLGFGAMSLSFL